MFAKDSIQVMNGTVTASGESQAMNVKPSDLSSYTITAGADPTGSEAEVINSTELSEISAYKYLRFNLSSPVAEIGGKTYASIAAAVEAVKAGETIQLLKNISLTEPGSITISKEDDRSFTINLNGKTINGKDLSPVIAHHGSGTLTITGGKLIMPYHNGLGSCAVIDVNGDGTLNIQSCTVENKEPSGGFAATAVSLSSGTVNIDNSILINPDASYVIAIYGTSTMNITNSEVKSTRNTYTAVAWRPIIIVEGESSKGGTLNISGGKVTGSNAPAIFVANYAAVNISGGAVIFSQNAIITDLGFTYERKPGAIYMEKGGSVTIADATVSNNFTNEGVGSYAIFAGENAGSRQTTFIIRKGTTILQGSYLATNLAPTLRPGLQGKASSNNNGTGLTNYDETQIGSYKYLEFKPIENYTVARIGEGTGKGTYTDLQAAVNAVGSDGTIQLVNNVDINGAVKTEGKSFTLDLNGKTLNGYSTVIEHSGGTLTIMDSAEGGGGTITCSGADSTIKLKNDSNLTVLSGTVAYAGTKTSAIHHNSSGSVEVKGGTVEVVTASADTKVIDNSSPGNINVNGGSVINRNNGMGIYNHANGNVNVYTGSLVQAMSGPAICNNANGTVNVFDGIVQTVTGYYSSGKAIYNNADGAVNISGGTVKTNVESGGDAAIFNNGTGKITISGNAVICNMNTSYENGTIVLNAGTSGDTVLEIKGGTITNGNIKYTSTGGYAIYNKTGAKIVISSGTAVISSRGKAMNAEPEIDSSLAGYGSTEFTGSAKTKYDPSKLDTYRYLVFQPATVPQAPTNFNVTQGNRQLSLSWKAPSDDGGRDILYYEYTIDDGEHWQSTDSIATSYAITDLEVGTECKIRVRAVNVLGVGAETTTITKRFAAVPDKITDVVLTPGNGKLTLTCTTPYNGGSDIIRYEYSTNGGETWINFISYSLTETQSFTISDLANGTPYTIIIRAVNAIGNGEPSAPVTATPATVPEKPTINTVTGGNGQIEVEFTPPTSNGGAAITEYKVKATPTSGESVTVVVPADEVTGTTKKVVITGLINGKSYSITVEAINRMGSAISSSKSAKPVSVPEAPTNLKATSGNGKLTLTWTAPIDNGGSAITGYKVSIDGGENWTSTGSISTTYTVTGLTNGTTYSIKVLAVNAIGDGAQSDRIEAKPGYAPGPPTNLQAVAGNESLQLKWDAPTDTGGNAIVYYEYSIDGGEWISTGSADTSYTVTGLTNGTSYTIRVRAFNSIFSGTAYVSITAAPSARPNPPTNVTAIAGDGKATVSFTLPVPDGGPAITEYIVTSTPGGKTASGTTNGTATITASQAGSDAYNAATPVSRSFSVNAVKPGAPTGVIVTAGDGKATVSFTSPVFNGGTEIIGYTVTSNPDGITASGTTNEIEVTGLTNGTSYTFTVRSVNSVGESLESEPSNEVTPKANQTITFETADSYDFGTNPTLTATASSGLTVTLISETPEVCTVENGVLTFLKAGTATITASQAGSDAYNAATPVSRSFTVNPVPADAPDNLVVTPGDGQLEMTWTAPVFTGGSVIDYYKYSFDGGTTWESTGSFATNYTVTGLINGREYTVIVCAYTNAGNGIVSSSASATPNLALSGIATINNTKPKVGDTLTGSLVDGNNTGTLSYVWKAGGVEVGTGENYTVTNEDLGKSITLEISSSVERGILTSAATMAVSNNKTGNGSSSGSRTSTKSDKPNTPTLVEVKVVGAVDGNDNDKVSLTEKTVTDAYNNAIDQAKKNGTDPNHIILVLNIDTGRNNATYAAVNLPKPVQDAIIKKKISNTIIVLNNPDIRIGMDLDSIQEINKQAKTDVNVTATRKDNSGLIGEAKKAIGSRPVFDLEVSYGSGKQVLSFGPGSVTVSIPYILGANEKAENVQAVYVDDKGKVHWLASSVYDSTEKVLRFSTNHFSTYGIGYRQNNIAFTDITSHWAKEDIEIVVSRGLFSGTSATTFSPNMAMTRGMFVTTLGRLANADVNGFTKSSFSDVKSDAYYMVSIEWAYKNNIVSGIGGDQFAPEQAITREQMAIIMSNYAKAIGFTLPKVYTEKNFADNDKISVYAKEAVKLMQMAGVISGKNSNLFDPQGTASRAEVSAVLHRFAELVTSAR